MFRHMKHLLDRAVFAGEACWWTIHPASKQRSEGEKVRVGDDLILVSVSSERYLVRLALLFVLCPVFAAQNSVPFCPLSPASVLRQRRSDGGCLLHANSVEHEPH